MKKKFQLLLLLLRIIIKDFFSISNIKYIEIIFEIQNTFCIVFEIQYLK